MRTELVHYNNIIANFYTRFSHEAQSAYSVLLPRSLDTFQCYTYSAQFPLPREHFLPGIAAYNGAGKFKQNILKTCWTISFEWKQMALHMRIFLKRDTLHRIHIKKRRKEMSKVFEEYLKALLPSSVEVI